MKILHINCADYGSTGKIISDISREAYSRGYSSYLLVPAVREYADYIDKRAVCFTHETGIYKRAAKVMGLRYGFAPVSTARIIGEIKRISPDVVHIHSANCNMVNLYRLFSFLKKKDIPTVVTNHAEFFYTGTCPHSEECDQWEKGCGNCPDIKNRAESAFVDRTHTAWMKMKKAFRDFPRMTMVSVSPWVDQRAKRSPITQGIEKKVVLNGLDTDVFSYKESNILREEYGIRPEEKIVLCVTALFDPENNEDIKGSPALVRIAQRLRNKNVRIVVVGQCAPYSCSLPENMIITGPVFDSEKLAGYYSEADLSVITSKRETFSMIVAESLSCGTPVAGFEAGGPESIAMRNYCRFFPQGDTDALIQGIENMISFKKTYDPKELSRKAHKIYSGKKMAEEYINIYKEMI